MKNQIKNLKFLVSKSEEEIKSLQVKLKDEELKMKFLTEQIDLMKNNISIEKKMAQKDPSYLGNFSLWLSKIKPALEHLILQKEKISVRINELLNELDEQKRNLSAYEEIISDIRLEEYKEKRYREQKNIDDFSLLKYA